MELKLKFSFISLLVEFYFIIYNFLSCQNINFKKAKHIYCVYKIGKNVVFIIFLNEGEKSL